MTTTLQIIEQHANPCAAGREFARNHPDPREALEVCLSATPIPTMVSGAADCDGWAWIRYCYVSIIGVEPYLKIWFEVTDGPLIRYRELTETCARGLREWLDQHHPIGGGS